MSKKKTHEEYVAELAIKNPNVEVVDKYINAHTLTLHKCLIDGYEWYAKPNNILSGKGCPVCCGTMKKTHEEYVHQVTTISPDIVVMENYINAKTPILHKCKKHNIIWKTSPCNILQGCGCSECSKEKIRMGNVKTHIQYVEELKTLRSDIVVLGEYINAYTPILHKCLIDQNQWYARPQNILSGKACPKCANNIKRTNKEYRDEVLVVNPDIEVVGEYINAYTPILHKCKLDGYEWYSSPTNILYGKGCPQCHESSGEREIRQLLEKHNITYEFQKSFIDCRDTKPLPFDFYLPDFNKAIEYDGKQHFEPIDFYGGQKFFKKTVKHDNIKNEYCKNNGIELLRIPYFKNVEEELNNFLFI